MSTPTGGPVGDYKHSNGRSRDDPRARRESKTETETETETALAIPVGWLDGHSSSRISRKYNISCQSHGMEWTLVYARADGEGMKGGRGKKIFSQNWGRAQKE